MGVSKALSGAKDVTEKLLPSIAKLAQDGSQEARNYAKSTLHRMMVERPEDFDRILKRYLTPNALRNIDKILEALKNPHQSAKGGKICRFSFSDYLCRIFALHVCTSMHLFLIFFNDRLYNHPYNKLPYISIFST